MDQGDDRDTARPILGPGVEAAEILAIGEISVARLVVQGLLPKAVKHQRAAAWTAPT